MNVNYKSDFALIVKFDEGIPTYPWRINFSTVKEGSSTQAGSYTALFDGESYIRAHPLGNSPTEVVIEFVGHALQPGTLRGEWSATFESALFDSGEQLVVTPQLTEVILVEGAGDESVDPEVWAIVSPVIAAGGDSSLATTAKTLSNDSVTINNDGIVLTPSPDSPNNVVSGLVGAVKINTNKEVEQYWFHNGLQGTRTVGVNYSTASRTLTVTIYSADFTGFGIEKENLYFTYSSYQRLESTYYEFASINLMTKYKNTQFIFIVGDDGNFPGLELFAFSNAQFWDANETES